MEKIIKVEIFASLSWASLIFFQPSLQTLEQEICSSMEDEMLYPWSGALGVTMISQELATLLLCWYVCYASAQCSQLPIYRLTHAPQNLHPLYITSGVGLPGWAYTGAPWLMRARKQLTLYHLKIPNLLSTLGPVDTATSLAPSGIMTDRRVSRDKMQLGVGTAF